MLTKKMRSVLYPSRASRAKAGFTLIELLAVIAIIALLVALLVPAISGARLKAAGVVCMSNLRTIGIAQKQYGADHEGIVPGSYRDSWWGYGCTWCIFDTLLLPYLPETGQSYSREFFYCPAAKFAGVEYRPTGSYVPMHPWNPRPSSWTRCYVINRAFTTSEHPVRSVYYSEVPAPASTIILGERRDDYRGQFHWSYGDLQAPNLPGWHGGKDNYLMVAGNVVSMDYPYTIGSGSLGNPRGMWTIEPND